MFLELEGSGNWKNVMENCVTKSDPNHSGYVERWINYASEGPYAAIIHSNIHF
jgi:hypothetical protein